MTTEVDTIAKMENQLERNKKLIANRDAAIALNKNASFKKLIIEGFMTEECARYAQLSADPSMPVESRADSLAMAQAAGHLKRFLSVTIRMGDVAENDNKALAEEIEAIRSTPSDEEA